MHDVCDRELDVLHERVAIADDIGGLGQGIDIDEHGEVLIGRELGDV